MSITLRKIIFMALFVLYPVIIYLGLMYFDARSVAVLLILLVGARVLFSGRKNNQRNFEPQIVFFVIGAGILGFVVIVSNSEFFLLFYPVCMNSLMLTLFFVSLLRPPSIIERIARMQNPKLPRSAIRYTRNVTIIWCAFFALNGIVALYTALFSTLEIWTLYNGIIAYVLMGILFAGEYLIRRRFQNSALA